MITNIPTSLYMRILEKTSDGVLITDKDQIIQYINPAFTFITGYQSWEVIGKTPTILKSFRHNTSFYSDMWDCIHSNGGWQGVIWNRRKNGDIFPEWLTISVVDEPETSNIFYVGFFSDISILKERENQLKHLAFHDSLTQLPNRILFKDLLNKKLKYIDLSSFNIVVLFIDIDRFKEVNDTYGHHIGDLLLQEVAKMIKASFRITDTVARWSGDEFVVLFEVDKSKVIKRIINNIAQSLIAKVCKPYHLEKNTISPNISIGASIYSLPGMNSAELISFADRAMYVAKKTQGSSFHIFDE